MLAIKYSPKNKKHFIACSAYPECKQTYSLPPYGMIKKLKEEKQCDKCGFPILMSLQRGKKPWFFCFNEKNHPDFKGFSQDRKIQTEQEKFSYKPECPTRKEREQQKELQIKEEIEENKEPKEEL